MSDMDNRLPPFPPTVDLRSAGWRLYGVEANNSITSRNNQIIARLAVSRIGFEDHIYDFAHVLQRERYSTGQDEKE